MRWGRSSELEIGLAWLPSPNNSHWSHFSEDCSATRCYATLELYQLQDGFKTTPITCWYNLITTGVPHAMWNCDNSTLDSTQPPVTYGGGSSSAGVIANLNFFPYIHKIVRDTTNVRFVDRIAISSLWMNSISIWQLKFRSTKLSAFYLICTATFL